MTLIKRLVPGPIRHAVRAIVGDPSFRKSPKYTTARSKNPTILQCCIAHNRYGGYCVPWASHHRPAAQAILRGEVWEPDTISFLRDYVGKGDIVHTGTFFGDFLPALASALKDGAKLYAFEPNPENYRCAAITCLLNGLTNVELHEAALGVEKVQCGWS